MLFPVTLPHFILDALDIVSEEHAYIPKTNYKPFTIAKGFSRNVSPYLSRCYKKILNFTACWLTNFNRLYNK